MGLSDLDTWTMKVFGRSDRSGGIESVAGTRKQRRKRKGRRLEPAIANECLVPQKEEENQQMGLSAELRNWVWGFLIATWLHNFCYEWIGARILGRFIRLP